MACVGGLRELRVGVVDVEFHGTLGAIPFPRWVSSDLVFPFSSVTVSSNWSVTRLFASQLISPITTPNA